MHNLSDDELDRLSREAAEQHRIPADASSWQKIATWLDRDMPSDHGFNYHVIPDLALLLILFIGLPVLNSVPAKQPAISIQQSDKSNSGKADNSQVASESRSSAKPAAENPIADKQSTIVPAIKQPETVKESAENPAVSAPTRSVSSGYAKDNGLTDKNTRESTGNLSGKTSTSEEREISMPNPQPFYSDQNDIAMSGSKSNQNARAWHFATLEETGNIHNAYTISGPSTLAAPGVFPKPVDIKKTESPTVANAAKYNRKNDPVSQSSSLLEFGITWGPDFSKVGEAPVGNVGNIAGFIAAFNINKRWSVNTGILYSNKNYTAMGDEYQKIPGYDPADPDIKIKKVMAECLMWDLPINVRYNWYWRPKQRAFASTGLSSYFMKEEDLKYWYTYYNNPKYKEWVNTKSSNYWFSVLNLSAGFEQQVFQGVTVQAEPFLKLSLSEVGYGKVNLKSWGIFLGLKYIPSIHRIKK